MSTSPLTTILALGALSGTRSMAGVATLAWGNGGVAKPLLALAFAGEMLADKTSIIGDRVDPLPLSGRALMGGIVGAVVAGRHDRSRLAGALLGAGAAVATAHLAYHARKRLPLSSVAGGLLEDALVLAAASRQA